MSNPGIHLDSPDSPTTLRPVRFADSTASVLLDLLRGLAALTVFAEHARNLFLVDFPQIISHRLLLAAPYVLTSAGHQAVIVFFILSGYFISGAIFRAVERGQWLWSDYLMRRLVRLWVVLVPALLLGVLWDRLGLALGRAPGLYGGMVANHMLHDVAQQLSPHIFLGNLFFVQTILVPTLGSNGALWSLANEFWYYLLFPLGYFALRPSTCPRQRWLYGMSFLALAWFVRGGVLGMFPIWLAGTLLCVLPAPRLSPGRARWARMLAAAVYALLFFSIAKLTWLQGVASDYLLTAVTFPLLWLLLTARQPAQPQAVYVRASREAARFSYTLYAVHTPVLVFLVSLKLGDTRLTPTLQHVLLACGICLGVLLYAWGLAYLTEFRTDTLRRWLQRRLHLPAPPAA